MESIVDERRARLAEAQAVRATDARRERRIGAGVSIGFHLLVTAVALWSVREALGSYGPGLQELADPAVFFVDALPPDPAALPGLNVADPAQDDPALRPGGESTSVTIRGFTFDFSKIGQRATMLFPFLTPGIAIDRFALTPAQVDTRLRVPAEFVRGEKSKADPARPALALDDSAFEALVDKSRSRRDRWVAFQPIAKLVDAYNPNAGQLPALLRAYTERNGLQPYADPGIRDPRLWTELQIAADHVDFIGFISRYVSEHPSTRAAIELLFMLDKLAQGSRDALVTLVDTEPYADLDWTRRSNLDALVFAARLQHHFSDVLDRQALAPRELLGAYYDNVRLRILSGILNTTPDGYRASDAHFLTGAIHWRQGRKAEAVRSWRQVTISPDAAYAVTNSEMVAELRAADNRPGKAISAQEIERILAADYGRWINAALDRLKKFGYRIDGY